MGAGSYKTYSDPMEACAGADLVTTDVWTSMGFEAENEVRRKAFAAWCVDRKMMAVAAPDALFMHCLPAHRGEEVEAEVIDGPQSVVWDEAENRMHVQKALMEYLLLGKALTSCDGVQPSRVHAVAVRHQRIRSSMASTTMLVPMAMSRMSLATRTYL